VKIGEKMLIECKDCKKEISKNANKCVHCGCPTWVGEQKSINIPGIIALILGVMGFIFTFTVWIDHDSFVVAGSISSLLLAYGIGSFIAFLIKDRKRR